MKYGVRIGDDGRWLLRTDSWVEAHEKAVQVSSVRLGIARVVEFATGRRDRYEWGDVVSEQIGRP